MSDLLTSLVSAQEAAQPGNLPIRVLAEWFLADCAAKNLTKRTIDFYKLKLHYLCEAAGDRPVNTVTTAQLRLIVQHFREKREWSVNNTNHCITTWKVFFRYLEQEELVVGNPAVRLTKLKAEQRLPDPLTSDEIRTLLANAGEGFVKIRNVAMLLVLLDCGLRLGELMGLTMADLDLATEQLRVFGKGRKERFVPFSGPVRRTLLKYLSRRHAITSDNSLWVDETGVQFSRDGFNSFLRRLEKRTKIRLHAHKFRHTYASQYIANGGNPAYLQRLLGHTTPAMTNRYIHLFDSDARNDHRQASPVANLLGPRWRG